MSTEPTAIQKKAQRDLRHLAEYALWAAFELEGGRTPYGQDTVRSLTDKYNRAKSSWQCAIRVREHD